ncbi:cell envelope biogenesis protein OmpA [Streptomyces sp. NPDC015184]|uniref:cell envelope biogenesis protein OmpA n=1 Tax=Streptomyces sp. NPDC015184 TaxID=3364946 RepID=UPI0036FFDE39
MNSAVPVRCLARPLAGGLVVPWVSLVHNGHAVFGSLDAGRARTAFLRRLCQICSQPLDERFFVIVRPADQKQGYSPEPALHPECQPYAAAHCPMLNGTATQYRTRPVLTAHPAGRPCSDPSCPCPVQSPDEGHCARSGQPAERYESWMISARHYRLTPHSGTGIPVGISLNVPILRKRVLREAALPPGHASLLALLRTALDLES